MTDRPPPGSGILSPWIWLPALALWTFALLAIKFL